MVYQKHLLFVDIFNNKAIFLKFDFSKIFLQLLI